MIMNRRDALKLAGASLAFPAFLSQTPCVWAADGVGKKAYSLHIGLDDVDQNLYPPGVPPLNGCIADARTYKKLIDGTKAFHDSRLLLSRGNDSHGVPTSEEVKRHILWAAQLLKAGDLFVVTYAGHGGSLTDLNGDEKDDGRDETWCLFDKQLRDDELYAMWAQFDPGVRILVISDSCHSGTVTREVAARGETQRVLGELRNTVQSKRALSDAEQSTLRAFGIDTATLSTDAARSAALTTLDTISARGSRGFDRGVSPRSPAPPPGGSFEFRALPEAIAKQDEQRNQRNNLDDKFKYLTEPRNPGDSAGRVSVAATGLLLAGCQDNQYSMESNGHGLFTSIFEEVVAGSNNYQELLNRVAARMPSSQRPNFFPFGAADDSFYHAQKPFAV